jgi:hypothetical protein
MGVQIKNNAFSTLLAGINSTTTTISVAVGEGPRFPAASVASGNYFYATILDTSNNLEVVKVTDRTNDTLTVVRGQDGSTARSFALGDRIELRVTAALLGDLPIRELGTDDIQDNSITAVKLAASGVSAGNFGAIGRTLTLTVNSKGQLTAVTQISGIVQRNQFDFTSRDAVQSWNKPDNAGSLVRVQLWGAGGGGGRCGSGAGGAGGGGGGYFEQWYSIDELPSSASIVIGEGGSGATVNNTDGVNGQASTFTAGAIVLTAWAGGGGGAQDGTAAGAGGGGAGLLSSGGRGIDILQGQGGAFGGGFGGEANTGDATTTAVPPVTILNSAVTVNLSGGIPSHEWGGGGGGGGNAGAVSGAEATGGWAIWGGGGGGGGYDGAKTQFGGDGGRSVFGGSGGNGNTNAVAGANGATPAGGGGGSELANGGNGGQGRCIVTVY